MAPVSPISKPPTWSVPPTTHFDGALLPAEVPPSTVTIPVPPESGAVPSVNENGSLPMTAAMGPTLRDAAAHRWSKALNGTAVRNGHRADPGEADDHLVNFGIRTAAGVETAAIQIGIESVDDDAADSALPSVVIDPRSGLEPADHYGILNFGARAGVDLQRAGTVGADDKVVTVSRKSTGSPIGRPWIDAGKIGRQAGRHDTRVVIEERTKTGDVDDASTRSRGCRTTTRGLVADYQVFVV